MKHQLNRVIRFCLTLGLLLNVAAKPAPKETKPKARYETVEAWDGDAFAPLVATVNGHKVTVISVDEVIAEGLYHMFVVKQKDFDGDGFNDAWVRYLPCSGGFGCGPESFIVYHRGGDKFVREEPTPDT